MSNNKAIFHGKEKRKPYRGAKAIDKTCRNHGSCEVCLSNRQYSSAKRSDTMQFREREYRTT